MDTKTIIVLVLSLFALICLIFIFRILQKSRLKSQVDELNVRFNEIKTLPLAFKLNKAQAIAKRNAESSIEVQEYYKKFEEAQKHIDSIQGLMNGIDDAISSRNYSEAKEAIRVVSEHISDSENEVKNIDDFLQQFSKKEEAQREYSRTLKEEFRDIKLSINNNLNSLKMAYDGLEKKLSKAEDLFSSSEEWMYANEYNKAQDDLEEIEKINGILKNNISLIPGYISDIKGVIPNKLEEAERQYALVRQRGLYIEHLDIDGQINKVKELINDDQRTLSRGDIDNVGEHIKEAKKILENIDNSFEELNNAYNSTKQVNEDIIDSLGEIERVKNYVTVTYQNDRSRFGLEDISEYLTKQSADIENYRFAYMTLSEDLLNNIKPTTTLLEEAHNLLDKINLDKETLLGYKNLIDKSNNDEDRAINQLMKLQVVVNEVELKVSEYHLPTISEAYKDDLIKSRQYIADIKKKLDEIPLNIEELNALLKEAIDFIYKFYNNVNNVVGMAIMVENAIVFGNKYRSTYPEIDRELSKAEFSFLNGEYTRALTIAINCMETLFPNNADEKIMENA